MCKADFAASAQQEFATEVVKRLAAAGYRAVFAGGCVRDLLRNTVPSDFDVATSAAPEEVLKLFPRAIPVGMAFGVVRVLSPGSPPEEVEVATFRGETAYSDGRHPDQVVFTDEVEDVKRRDFTINGLLYDPIKREVLDYVEGRRDLERKLIRAIGDPQRRFSEDRLRMLRAVRFAARLSFEIDGPTLGAIKRHAQQITAISAERIRDELNLILTGPAPRRGMELLKQTGLLKPILPEAAAMDGVPQPPQFHPEGDVWTHTMLLLENLSDAPLELAWAALLHDVGKPPTLEHADRIRFNEHERVGAAMTEAILTRLKFSNEQIAEVAGLVRQHMAFKDVQRMRPSTLKRFLRQPHFDEHLELHRLDCTASHGSLDNYEFCREQRDRIPQEQLAPPPLITGKDLIALGLTPGPAFKVILKDIEDQQLEGRLSTHEAALACIRSRLKDGSISD